ncbi:MAG TPA: hypothetical protein VME69_06115 [Methylocella sp.]|nr:hypothetical protein [Methylocella sp.]
MSRSIGRDQGISKSGNRRLGRIMIELAWFWQVIDLPWKFYPIMDLSEMPRGRRSTESVPAGIRLLLRRHAIGSFKNTYGFTVTV